MMRLSSSPERAAFVIVILLLAGRAVAQDAAPAVPAAQPDPDLAFTFDERPTLKAGPLTVGAIAQFQLDWHRFAGLDADWEIHRARLGIDGQLFRIVEYQVERELTDDTDAWRDVYVDVAVMTPLQVRAGRFKIPFSLDELTGSAELDFAYRSLAGSSLAPGRDVGVAAHGRLFERRVRYDVGLFRQGGENVRASERREPSSSRTLAARVTYAPWREVRRSPLRDLTIGGGMTAGDLPEGLHSIGGRTVADEPFFPRVYVNGQRHRLGVDVEWRRRAFGVRAEAMRVLDDRRGQSTDDGDLPRVQGDGAYVSGTWIVTGEDKVERVRPRRPLFQGGIGAIEVAGRLERLAFASTSDDEVSDGPRASVFPRRRLAVATFGANWYLNRFVRLQLNAIREHRGESGAVGGEGASWSHVLRIQFSM